MRGVSQQVGVMLRAPWQWRRNEGAWALAGFGLMVLLALATALAALAWVPWPQAGFIVGVIAAVVLMSSWGLQFSTLLRLDHPHLAHLLPGHGRALRTAALTLWLLGVALSTAGVLLMARGLLGLGNLPVLVVALAAGATLLWLAMALRWWWMWGLIWLPLPVLDVFGLWSRLEPALALLRGLWQAQPVLWTVVALTGMGVALCSLFGQADAAHARAYASRERLRRIAAAGAAGQRPPLATYGRWGEVLGSPFQALADGWLANVLRSASLQPASVMARADLVLQGQQHWLRQLAALALFQVVVVIGVALLTALLGEDVAVAFELGHIGLGIGLLSMAIGPLLNPAGALWLTRREQALLVLLPGMPQGPGLNRLLARRQLRQFLLMWLAVLPAFLGMVWWSGAPQVLGFLGAALPLSALMWRDTSRLQTPTQLTSFLPYLLFIGLGLLSMVFLRSQPTLLWPWALACLALTVALLSWRWRGVSHWPQSLPAGRR